MSWAKAVTKRRITLGIGQECAGLEARPEGEDRRRRARTSTAVAQAAWPMMRLHPPHRPYRASAPPSPAQCSTSCAARVSRAERRTSYQFANCLVECADGLFGGGDDLAAADHRLSGGQEWGELAVGARTGDFGADDGQD